MFRPQQISNCWILIFNNEGHGEPGFTGQHKHFGVLMGYYFQTRKSGKDFNPGDGAIVVLPYHTSCRGWYSCYSEGLDS